jgi:hypothetical protein
MGIITAEDTAEVFVKLLGLQNHELTTFVDSEGNSHPGNRYC